MTGPSSAFEIITSVLFNVRTEPVSSLNTGRSPDGRQKCQLISPLTETEKLAEAEPRGLRAVHEKRPPSPGRGAGRGRMGPECFRDSPSCKGIQKGQVRGDIRETDSMQAK